MDEIWGALQKNHRTHIIAGIENGASPKSTNSLIVSGTKNGNKPPKLIIYGNKMYHHSNKKRGKFTIYGNCQIYALLQTLLEYKDFKENFDYIPLKAVQDLRLADVGYVVKAIEKSDLIIYQHVSKYYGIRALSTARILSHAKINSIPISFPSLYFDGYFPHLAMLPGRKSVLLDTVHDYVIMYGYLMGLEQQEIIEVIQSEDFYSEELSNRLLKKSINDLIKREESNNVDIKISDYIKKNYRFQKLFNHFNHPRRPIFEYITFQILDILGMAKNKYLHYDGQEGYLDAMSTPIYRSTYNNLALMFPEDFSTYNTTKGLVKMPEVVSDYYSTYDTMDKTFMMNKVLANKPFIIQRFNEIMPEKARRYFVSSKKEKFYSKLRLGIRGIKKVVTRKL